MSRVTVPRAPVAVDGRIVVGAALAALAVSVAAALQVAEKGWRPAVILVAGLLGGVVLLALAVYRFEAFVLTVLAVRAAADWTQGSTEVANQPIISGGAGAPLVLAFLLASVVWLAAQSSQLGRPRFSALSLALLAVTAACLVSVAGSTRPMVSLVESVRFLSAASMYIVLERLLTDGTALRRVLYACYASALLPLAMGITDLATGTVPFQGVSGFSRLEATFAHPNAYGFYLALMMTMGVALLPHIAGRLRLGLAALLVVAFGQLVLTYSRGGWITLLVGLVVVALLQPRLPLVFLMVGCLALPVLVPSVGARLSDLDDERTLLGTGGNSLVWRVDHWRESLRVVDERPLTGIGLKMTTVVTPEQKAPHNDYVRMYVEVGLLGLATYLALLLALIRGARRALARAPAGLPRGTAVGFAACLAGFVVVSAASNRITSVVELWYFFAFAAAAQASSRSAA